MAKEKLFLICISNASIKCKSLTRKRYKINKTHALTHTHHTQHTNKSHSNMNNNK